MRLSASDPGALLYRVYDYPAGQFRTDLCWADDELNQVGVGHAHIDGEEFVSRIEQRIRVLIITALRWVALDLPEEEEKSKSNNHILTPVEAKGIADKILSEYVVAR